MPDVICELIDLYPFRQLPDRVEFLQLRRAADDALGNTWQAVHGRIEAAESAWRAALRELHEETGLRPLKLWQIDAVNTFYLARTDQVHLCPCFAAQVHPAAVVQLCAEHSASRWVPVAVLHVPLTDPAGLTPPRAAWRISRNALRAFMWPGQRRAVREIVTEILRMSVAEPHLRIDIGPNHAASAPDPADPRDHA